MFQKSWWLASNHDGGEGLEKLVIEGGKPLKGTIQIHGSKNAALPILAACLLADGVHVLRNIPELVDIEVMLQILRTFGCHTIRRLDELTIHTSGLRTSYIPNDLMKQMRSSIFLMGPVLARLGEVTMYKPGGCAIGERKIDWHLQGLQALGVTVHEHGNEIRAQVAQLIGTDITLQFPSVGATENLMMAAVLAQGVTSIQNAAREPEIQDLQNFLNHMGANIIGAGTSTITIQGVESLKPTTYRIIPDRIVAGTCLIAAAATRGTVKLEKVYTPHLTAVIHVLKRIGHHLDMDEQTISITGSSQPKAIDRLVTAPYPAFPTDLQSPMMVLLSLANGVSMMKETIFESRFQQVEELSRMGADIYVRSNLAILRGVPRLYGATVEATDLRAGAALVVAGLAAQGTTIVEKIHFIDRGYARIEQLFSQLGATVNRTTQLTMV